MIWPVWLDPDGRALGAARGVHDEQRGKDERRHGNAIHGRSASPAGGWSARIIPGAWKRRHECAYDAQPGGDPCPTHSARSAPSATASGRSRGRPERRHPPRGRAPRHARRRAGARHPVDAAGGHAVEDRRRAHASARRFLGALRVSAARRRRLRRLRLRHALPQQRHRLPARGARRRREARRRRDAPARRRGGGAVREHGRRLADGAGRTGRRAAATASSRSRRTRAKASS